MPAALLTVVDLSDEQLASKIEIVTSEIERLRVAYRVKPFSRSGVLSNAARLNTAIDRLNMLLVAQLVRKIEARLDKLGL